MRKVIEKSQRDFQKKENDSPNSKTKFCQKIEGKPKSVKVVKTVSTGPTGIVSEWYTVAVYLEESTIISKSTLRFTELNEVILENGISGKDCSGHYLLFVLKKSSPEDEINLEIINTFKDGNNVVAMVGEETEDVCFCYETFNING